MLRFNVGGYVRNHKGALAKILHITNRRGNPCKMILHVFKNNAGYPDNRIVPVKIANYNWEPVSKAFVILYADKDLTLGERIHIETKNPCVEIIGKCDWHYNCFSMGDKDDTK